MRLLRRSGSPHGVWISIHASREGCDCLLRFINIQHFDFNPRIPRGMRPLGILDPAVLSGVISIHASREGCDNDIPGRGYVRIDFNPRIPRGMRQMYIRSVSKKSIFQSTHPARDATWTVLDIRTFLIISIHASREGCDRSILSVSSYPTDFNPRIPRGMRRRHHSHGHCPGGISIHASREGCDNDIPGRGYVRIDFNPRIPRGMRL